jgi:hypothetical protein
VKKIENNISNKQIPTPTVLKDNKDKQISTKNISFIA